MGAIQALFEYSGVIALGSAIFVSRWPMASGTSAVHPPSRRLHDQFTVYIVWCCIYNLYFHPLAKYPGPFLAKISPVSHTVMLG